MHGPNHYGSTEWNDRADISPAAVTVKPLPWRESYGVTRADTDIGTWYLKGKIAEFSKQPFSMVVGDDPKADVQAHHEKMLNGLVNVTPAPVAGWREGNEQAAELVENFTNAKHVAQDIKDGFFPEQSPVREAMARAIREMSAPGEQHDANFQQRVAPWMQECFGPEISADVTERNHRFLEEALELVQSKGCTANEAHQLVDYVFGRDVGDPHQEVGGVMVTLAALCLAAGLDMDKAAEDELARIWTKVDKIRAKQAAKPKHSPLPQHVKQPDAVHKIVEELLYLLPENELDWTEAKIAAVKVYLKHTSPAQPVALMAAVKAALRALSGQDTTGEDA